MILTSEDRFPDLHYPYQAILQKDLSVIQIVIVSDSYFMQKGPVENSGLKYILV